MFNEQHKKESPILGMLGLGGGIARAGGGGGPVEISGALFAMFGGGGSGGAWVGGGGGGGGYVEETVTLETKVAYPFTIGAAGATPDPGPSATNANVGNPGGNTTFSIPPSSQTYYAYGGGGGGANGVTLGRPGGAGGGGFNPSAPPPGAGLGNRVGGPTNSTTLADGSPPQPQPLSRVQGYDGGAGSAGDGMVAGGGGAGGAGSGATFAGGGPGGAAITLTNFGPLNGTYGGGGGGAATHGLPGGTGAGDAGNGVMTNETAKNAGGRANGGGGVREGGYVGGSATAGILLFRVPDAFTVSLSNPSGSNQAVTGGYRYISLTNPGTITFNG